MIATLFKYWKKSKEQQIIDCALRLEKILNEIGREPANNGEAASINIYEYSHRDLHELNCNHGQNQLVIRFNKKGEIVK